MKRDLVEDFDSCDDAERSIKPRVKKACAHCHRLHVSCTDERPCKRCICRGLSCEDYTPKKRGRKKSKPVSSDNEEIAQIKTVISSPESSQGSSDFVASESETLNSNSQSDALLDLPAEFFASLLFPSLSTSTNSFLDDFESSPSSGDSQNFGDFFRSEPQVKAEQSPTQIFHQIVDASSRTVASLSHGSEVPLKRRRDFEVILSQIGPMYDDLPIATFAWENGTIKYTNSAFQCLTGHSRIDHILKLFSPRSMESYVNIFKSVFSDVNSTTFMLPCEFRFGQNASTDLYQRDGEFVMGTLTCQIKRDTFGSPLMLVGFFSPSYKRFYV